MLDDGGPAYPQTVTTRNDQLDWSDEFAKGGKTLLDWFAGKAMPELIALGEELDLSYAKQTGDFPEACAVRAYQYAAAMIAEKRRLEAEK